MTDNTEHFLTFVNEHAINEQMSAFEHIAYVKSAKLVDVKGRFIFKVTLVALPNTSKAKVGAYLLWLNSFAFSSMKHYNSPAGEFSNRFGSDTLFLECWDSPTVFPEMHPFDFTQKVAESEHSDFFVEDDPRMMQDSWKWMNPDETQFSMEFYEISDESFGLVHLVDRKEYLETENNWQLTNARLVKFDAYESRLASQSEPF